jgi:hypothetical protein
MLSTEVHSLALVPAQFNIFVLYGCGRGSCTNWYALGRAASETPQTMTAVLPPCTARQSLRLSS